MVMLEWSKVSHLTHHDMVLSRSAEFVEPCHVTDTLALQRLSNSEQYVLDEEA
jgi:hypothetical protein